MAKITRFKTGATTRRTPPKGFKAPTTYAKAGARVKEGRLGKKR